MPTVNPRVNVTLSPSLYGMVDELAKHQRVSKAMVLRELLEASEPALAQVVAMLKAAASMNDAARKRLVQDMDSTIASMEQKKEQALALAAGVTADLVAQAEAIKGRRPRRMNVRKRSADVQAVGSPTVVSESSAAVRPPSSNRGVKPKPVATKQIALIPLESRSRTTKAGVKSRGVKQS